MFGYTKNNVFISGMGIIVFFFTMLISVEKSTAQVVMQSYPEGKIFLKSGTIVEGKNLEITSNTAILVIADNRQEFNLNEIQQIMARKGKAKEMGNICGGGCLSLALVSFLSSGGEVTDEYGNTQKIEFGTYMIGTAMWAAIFYGAGYLIGKMMDDWQVIYFGT